MPIWKTTENLLSVNKQGEYFDENWMNYNSIYSYAPKLVPWKENRPIRFEDVDIWEVICEASGPVGVYAAWQPFAEYYVVMKHWSIWAEFEGWEANKRLEQFLIDNNIEYPYTEKNTTLISYMALKDNSLII